MHKNTFELVGIILKKPEFVGPSLDVRNLCIMTKGGTVLKVPLGPEFWYSIFLHFQTQFVVLSHHAKFQLITTTRSRFFRTVFVEILRPPLLALVLEAGLRMSGSVVRGSPQTSNLKPAFTWLLATGK